MLGMDKFDDEEEISLANAGKKDKLKIRKLKTNIQLTLDGIKQSS